MGGSIFEGWVISEAWKVFAGLCRKEDIYFRRSHDGLEVDLIVRIDNKLHPIEIKRTATPTLKLIEPIDKFKRLAGKDAADQGLLVCRVKKKTVLPNNNVAMPWHEFPSWVMDRLEAADK